MNFSEHRVVESTNALLPWASQGQMPFEIYATVGSPDAVLVKTEQNVCYHAGDLEFQSPGLPSLKEMIAVRRVRGIKTLILNLAQLCVYLKPCYHLCIRRGWGVSAGINRLFLKVARRQC